MEFANLCERIFSVLAISHGNRSGEGRIRDGGDGSWTVGVWKVRMRRNKYQMGDDAVGMKKKTLIWKEGDEGADRSDELTHGDRQGDDIFNQVTGQTSFQSRPGTSVIAEWWWPGSHPHTEEELTPDLCNKSGSFGVLLVQKIRVEVGKNTKWFRETA